MKPDDPATREENPHFVGRKLGADDRSTPRGHEGKGRISHAHEPLRTNGL